MNTVRAGLLLSLFGLLVLAPTLSSSAKADPRLDVAWRVRLDNNKPLAYRPMQTAGPTVTPDGRWVFAGTASGDLLKVDAVSGEIWYKAVLKSAITAAPLLVSSSVVVCTEDGYILRLADTDLKPVWSTPPKLPATVRHTPVLVGDSVLAVVDDRSVLTTISLIDGAVLNSSAEYSYSERRQSPVTILGSAPPASLDGQLVAGFDSGVVASFVVSWAESGAWSGMKAGWQTRLCTEGELGKAVADASTKGIAPLCSRRRIFRDADTGPTETEYGLLTGCYCRGLIMLSPIDGKILWETPLLGPTTPLVDDEKAIVATGNGQVAAVSLATGETLWRTQVENGLIGQPVRLENLQYSSEPPVIMATGVGLVALNAKSGEILARMTAMHGVSAQPGTWENSIFVLSNEGHLYRIDYFW